MLRSEFASCVKMKQKHDMSLKRRSFRFFPWTRLLLPRRLAGTWCYISLMFSVWPTDGLSTNSIEVGANVVLRSHILDPFRQNVKGSVPFFDVDLGWCMKFIPQIFIQLTCWMLPLQLCKVNLASLAFNGLVTRHLWVKTLGKTLVKPVSQNETSKPLQHLEHFENEGAMWRDPKVVNCQFDILERVIWFCVYRLSN